MKRHTAHARGHVPTGPTQRQLRAGELIRHALVEVMREEEINDPDLAGVSVTVSEVRMSPDLKHAICFVEPLGAGIVDRHPPEVVGALNRHAKFLRGRLGHHIKLKFTPDLQFLHDESFEEAARMNRLFDDPRVRRDILSTPVETGEWDHPQHGGGGDGRQGAEDADSADEAAPSTTFGGPPPPRRGGGE
jgi:ribosome-binding factor A